MIGRIVCSKSGRDKGYFMVIIGTDGDNLLVCDGKERPIERPKKKNIKHLSLTNSYFGENSYKTNKSLKRALAIYRSTSEQEENLCQKRI